MWLPYLRKRGGSSPAVHVVDVDGIVSRGQSGIEPGDIRPLVAQVTSCLDSLLGGLRRHLDGIVSAGSLGSAGGFGGAFVVPLPDLAGMRENLASRLEAARQHLVLDRRGENNGVGLDGLHVGADQRQSPGSSGDGVVCSGHSRDRRVGSAEQRVVVRIELGPEGRRFFDAVIEQQQAAREACV